MKNGKKNNEFLFNFSFFSVTKENK